MAYGPGVARLGTACLALVAATPAAAHGFGQRFDLAIPLWLWVLGAGATVLVSFLAAADFFPNRLSSLSYPRIDLLRWGPFRALTGASAIGTLRVFGVLCFLATLLAGFLGTLEPERNLAPTMVWILFWVGVAFACALIGDLWALVNPLRTLFSWAEALYRLLTGRRTFSPEAPYPPGLGVWPSVVLLACFAWTELVWAGNDVPRNLAWMMLGYALFTWCGMLIYGREVWLQSAEVFSVAFGVLARFAPLELRVSDRAAIAGCRGALCRAKTEDCVNGYVCLNHAARGHAAVNLRPPAMGLLDERPVPTGIMVFVVLMLSMVTFDGAMETAPWRDFMRSAEASPLLQPVVAAATSLGIDRDPLMKTLGLTIVPAVFLLCLLMCSALMAMLARYVDANGPREPLLIARTFVLSLVPIAIAYHLAHYLPLLLTAGQLVIPLISDPLGYGWDLFGTAGYETRINLVSTRFVWYFSVTAVVLGHVASVLVGHMTALWVFGTARSAFVTQLPLVALMVAYTMVSLWIMGQPTVG